MANVQILLAIEGSDYKINERSQFDGHDPAGRVVKVKREEFVGPVREEIDKFSAF